MNPMGPNASQYFCDIEHRPAKTVAEGVKIRTFWGDHMLISIVELEANAVVPMHTHSEEQIGTVLSGEMVMIIGDEEKALQAGDTYIIPGDVPHKAVVGGGPARAIDVFNPVRKDYMY